MTIYFADPQFEQALKNNVGDVTEFLHAFDGHTILFAGFFKVPEPCLVLVSRSEIKHAEQTHIKYHMLVTKHVAGLGFNYDPASIQKFDGFYSTEDASSEYTGVINKLYALDLLDEEEKFMIESILHKNVGLLSEYFLMLNQAKLDDPEYTVENAAEDVANFALDSRYMFVPLEQADSMHFKFASNEKHVFELKRKLPKYIKIVKAAVEAIAIPGTVCTF